MLSIDLLLGNNKAIISFQHSSNHSGSRARRALITLAKKGWLQKQRQSSLCTGLTGIFKFADNIRRDHTMSGAAYIFQRSPPEAPGTVSGLQLIPNISALEMLISRKMRPSSLGFLLS